MTKKLLIANRFDHGVLLRAQQNSQWETHWNSDLSNLQEHFSDCEALILRSSSQMDRDRLKKFPNLKLIVTATSGFDHLDLQATQDLGIHCCHTPEAQMVAAAEMTLLMLFASYRKFSRAFLQMAKGDWKRELLAGRQISGKTLGIVGLGRVGKQVAQRANGLGLKVQAFDPYELDGFEGVEMLGFEELMRSSDIVSLHVPKTRRTRHMIKKDTLDWMDPEALLINMSRGDVINEAELIEHLQENGSFQAALDVFQSEPLSPSSPLFSLPNVTLAPHIGASTQEALRLASEQALTAVESFFQKGHTDFPLPPKAAWWGE